MHIDTLSLPKLVESDPRYPQVMEILARNTLLLWQGGDIEIPSVPLTEKITAAMRKAHDMGKVIRGLEGAEKHLANEDHGLELADRHSITRRNPRVSRLMILSNDGSERFYRRVETLMLRYAPRLISLRVDVDALKLGQLLYGPGRMARLLLIEHKDLVSSVLLALVQE